jgi:hypothetical protein
MIDHYVDDPIDYDFPYHFAEKGIFHTEYFDKGENFIIYRTKAGSDFHVFDIKLKGTILGMPIKWEFEGQVLEAVKDKIRFHKDMSNLDLGDSNHLAIQYDESKFAIVHYDKSLKAKNIFYVDSAITDSARVRFYKKKLYILKNNELVILSFPNGFNMPFVSTKKTYIREYNDFTVNRLGVFLFIRGYSELIAAEGPNPEGLKIKKYSHNFRHGAFHDSGFGTTILAYTDKEFSHTKYFVSFQPSTTGKHKQHQTHSIEKKLEHSLNMSEIPAPKESDPKKFRMLQTSTQVYYLYPKLSHGEIEVFYKGSKLGKSVMV